ncbi:hypothetical protein ACGFNP_35015 [Nonomuraea sp. NPDC049269]|uniref:hypothetical protein n=1 Tax=Nonomuraea sp. NPDC049269 TaxID=3364349 RepID=UPI003718DCEB
MDSGDLRKLLIPLGLKEEDFNQELLNRLDDLSDVRNRASHLKINRAKSMVEPVREWDRVLSIVALLDPLDKAIEEACMND